MVGAVSTIVVVIIVRVLVASCGEAGPMFGSGMHYPPTAAPPWAPDMAPRPTRPRDPWPNRHWRVGDHVDGIGRMSCSGGRGALSASTEIASVWSKSPQKIALKLAKPTRNWINIAPKLA